VFCGLCDRRMIGSFNDGRNHYRCTYSSEYADANRLAHPRSLYLREDKIVELVDPWIRRGFAPANLRTTLQAMADAQHDDAEQHRVIAAREKISTCQTKPDRYRTALDAGTDPVLAQQWITQVQAGKAVAEADLRQLTGRRTMTADEINTWSKQWPASRRSCGKQTPRTKPRSTGNLESSSHTSQASA
jgi:site-specific DNA recombinase